MGEQALSLVFAIPDHPWVDVADGAAVRIAMTVAQAGPAMAVLREVVEERDTGEDEIDVALYEKRGLMFADLKVGANVAGAVALRANAMLSNRGVIPHGEGMTVSEEQAVSLGLGRVPGIEKHLRPYRNGRDITQTSRNVRVIDMFGLTAEDVRDRFPEIYQWLLERVKPERDQNPRPSRRDNWWLFGENQPKMRDACAGLSRYVVTIQTSKHRFFTFLDSEILPDDKLIAIGHDDAWLLAVLSSQIHVVWALAAGSRLGIGNDPVYNKTTCFECFPFPDLEAADKFAGPVSYARVDRDGNERAFQSAGEYPSERIRTLAEQLDAHRKRQQAAHPDLTLTGMYNVLEKLRSGEALSAKERTIHEHGLVSVLRQLHDDLDAAVLDAYGWSDLLPLLRVAHGNDAPAEGQTRDEAKRAFDEAVLERLVALNAERAAEEARGLVRWLRPEFQNPQQAPRQAVIDAPVPEDEAPDGDDAPATVAPAAKPQPWPKDAVAQVRAIADLLAASPAPLSLDDIAARFTARGPWRKRLPQVLDMLTALGRARRSGDGYRAND